MLRYMTTGRTVRVRLSSWPKGEAMYAKHILKNLLASASDRVIAENKTGGKAMKIVTTIGIIALLLFRYQPGRERTGVIATSGQLEPGYAAL
jgi:hypothetical protein